jgi:hypothetical protein
VVGVVINQKPWRWREWPGVRLVLLLLAGLVMLMLFWIITYREPPSEDWTLAQLTKAVRQGEVSHLHISGERVIVETKPGLRGQVRNAEGISIIELLRERGVPEERLSALSILSVAPSGPLHWLLRWLLSLPIVILILGLGRIWVNRRDV